MRQLIRENSLSLVLFGLFLASAFGQALTGWHANLEELRQHAEPAIAFTEYLRSGHYLSAVFENWESEFLQMGAYVLLTVFLRQKGSPESKPIAAPTTRPAAETYINDMASIDQDAGLRRT